MVHLPQNVTKTVLTHSHIDISKTFSCGVPCPPAMLFTQVWVKKSATRNWTAGFDLWFHLPGLAPFWSHPIFDNHRQVVLRPAFAGQEVCTPSASFCRPWRTLIWTPPAADGTSTRSLCTTASSNATAARGPSQNMCGGLCERSCWPHPSECPCGIIWSSSRLDSA